MEMVIVCERGFCNIDIEMTRTPSSDNTMYSRPSNEVIKQGARLQQQAGMQNERTGDLLHGMLHQGPIVGHHRPNGTMLARGGQISLTSNTTTTSRPGHAGAWTCNSSQSSATAAYRRRRICHRFPCVARNERLSTSFIILTTR